MAAKQEAKVGVGKKAGAKLIEPTAAEINLLEAVVDFQTQHAEALQQLTKRLTAASQRGPIFQSPTGQRLGKCVAKLTDHSVEIGKETHALVNAFNKQAGLPAEVKPRPKSVKTGK